MTDHSDVTVAAVGVDDSSRDHVTVCGAFTCERYNDDHALLAIVSTKEPTLIKRFVFILPFRLARLLYRCVTILWTRLVIVR